MKEQFSEWPKHNQVPLPLEASPKGTLLLTLKFWFQNQFLPKFTGSFVKLWANLTQKIFGGF